MARSSFSWLHLTDLHFGMDGLATLWPNLRRPFLDDLEATHRRTGPWNAVFLTGDLTQTGQPEQYVALRDEFLARLWQRPNELGSGEAVLLAVPGNHDLVRPKLGRAPVDMLLSPGGFERVADTFWSDAQCDYRVVVNSVFEHYSGWWRGSGLRPASIVDGMLPGDFSCTLDAAGRKVGIIGLNTAFLQLDGSDFAARLHWNAAQLQAVCGQIDDWVADHDVCMLLTHHGPDWLATSAKRHGDAELAPPGRFAFHFFGHMHDAEYQHLRRGFGPTSRLCQGCSVFGMDDAGRVERWEEVRSGGTAAATLEYEGDLLVRQRQRWTDAYGDFWWTTDWSYDSLDRPVLETVDYEEDGSIELDTRYTWTGDTPWIASRVFEAVSVFGDWDETVTYTYRCP